MPEAGRSISSTTKKYVILLKSQKRKKGLVKAGKFLEIVSVFGTRMLIEM
jgi:hypothetical protein